MWRLLFLARGVLLLLQPGECGLHDICNGQMACLAELTAVLLDSRDHLPIFVCRIAVQNMQALFLVAGAELPIFIVQLRMLAKFIELRG